MKTVLSILTLFILSSTSYAHDAGYLIAKKYGCENWDKVESITYTFNVKSPRRSFDRTWTWWPHEDKVKAHAQDVTYTRGEGMDPEIDKGFINDVFWLLFPFQTQWDPTLTFEEEENVKDPISGETVHKLRCIYNNEDGYTPGDIYELFYTDDFTVTAWNFIRGGEGEGRPTVWKGNQDFNGILISTEHRNDQGMGLWFSDIDVKLKE